MLSLGKAALRAAGEFPAGKGRPRLGEAACEAGAGLELGWSWALVARGALGLGAGGGGEQGAGWGKGLGSRRAGPRPLPRSLSYQGLSFLSRIPHVIIIFFDLHILFFFFCIIGTWEFIICFSVLWGMFKNVYISLK